jgi:hypothetical protein
MNVLSKKVKSIILVALSLFITSSIIFVVNADPYIFGEGGAVFNAMLTEEGEEDLGENQGTTSAGISIEAPIVTLLGIGTGNPEMKEFRTKGNASRWQLRTIYDRPEFIARFGRRTTPVAFVSNNIEGIYHNSLDYNTIEHLAYEWSPKTGANAAANGSEFLQGVIGPIWAFSRDLAYGLLATILVVIGIMIMFRQKIGGQMLVSVQNSIPRLLMVILLISISLPLVGLMMDIGGFLNDFIATALPLSNTIITEGILNNPISLGFAMFLVFVQKTFTAADLIGIYVTSLFTAGATGIIAALIMLMLLIMFIMLAFKVWFMLISQLARLFLETALLPLNILVGAVPGNEGAVANSFKKILVLVMAFPVSYFLIRLAFFIALGSMEVALPTTYGFLNQNPAQTGLGSEIFTLVTMNGILMYGIMILVPHVPEILTELFQVQSLKSIEGAVKDSAADRAKVPLIGGLIGGK